MSSTTEATATVASSPVSRSKQEIQEMVKRRVQERDSWVKGPSHPPLMDLFKFLFSTKSPKYTPEIEAEFSVQSLDWSRLENPADDNIQITWLGHASLLIQVDGWNILADPVLSDRCSAVQWAGPKRYQPPPCRIQELLQNLEIDLVLISHNHYDHLDYTTVSHLAKMSNCRWVVPLGLNDWFRQHVSTKLVLWETDWHDSLSLKSESSSSSHPLKITSVPMRHWTNRTGDRDKTLWCGYVLESHAGKRILFPGDTAWFDGLSTIGDDYGPFDVAAIPIGAYEPRGFMKFSHINVEEAVQMKDAVKAKQAVPIHWGTFPLTIEPILEPKEKLLHSMKDRQDRDSFVPWLIGETKGF
jgi:N-acyl-phosphatidylethanolamine-hydrolysing phospholipase D